MKTFKGVGFAAKTLTKILLDETERLYGGRPGDDATVCTVQVRRREPVNLLIGPPSNRDDCGKMMSLFFSKKGKHIVCGGTTSTIAAEYLKKPVRPSLLYLTPDTATAEIEGVDLVTEGVITVNRVLEYAKNYIGDNSLYSKWSVGQDGASKVARMLFEEATDINFFVGRAVNPAHQNPTLPINFSIKMKLAKSPTGCLTKMEKDKSQLFLIHKTEVNDEHSFDYAAVDAILSANGSYKAIISILQDIQEHYHYLPREVSRIG